MFNFSKKKAEHPKQESQVEQQIQEIKHSKQIFAVMEKQPLVEITNGVL